MVPSTGPERWPRVLRLYYRMHALWFALYASFSKLFAYLGVPPAYAGEILLLVAAGSLLKSRRIARVLGTPLGAIYICFILWQVSCMVPYVSIWGQDSLRDGVIWAYSIFALSAAALLLKLPSALPDMVSRYGRFARFYVLGGPAFFLLLMLSGNLLQGLTSILRISPPFMKGDELCVHLAGLFAAMWLGLIRSKGWMLLAAPLMVFPLGMLNRGGLLSFLGAAAVSIVLRPHLPRLLSMFSLVIVGLTCLAVSDIHIQIPGRAREISWDQVVASSLSVAGSSEAGDLDDTKEWRLRWWARIWDYTVHGPYFLMGKGYGVNLCISDGFLGDDAGLRSPHSSHMTFLARSGVPGFTLWILLQLSWVGLMLRSYLSARARKAGMWPALFAWLIAYWLAFMLSASFDVFFEGPTAGIPYWTIFGVGWGSHLLYKRRAATAEFLVVPSLASPQSKQTLVAV